jgi:hypothetical protein
LSASQEHGLDLLTRALARLTISSTSSRAWAMTGKAPMASVTLAVSFITTMLVMWCTRGLRARMILTRDASPSSFSKPVLLSSCC